MIFQRKVQLKFTLNKNCMLIFFPDIHDFSLNDFSNGTFCHRPVFGFVFKLATDPIVCLWLDNMTVSVNMHLCPLCAYVSI